MPPSSRRAEKDTHAERRRISKPLNDLLAGKVQPGQLPAELCFANAIAYAQANKDPAMYLKLAQIAAKEEADEAVRLQMLKTEEAKEQIAQEKAARLKIENELRRGQYIDKAVVKLLWGKNYAVDTSVLMPLGLKLADTITALPESADRRNKIQEIIDNEIFQALEMKQRLMTDYVQGADGLDNE
jgi:hypothetical protein